MAYRILRGRHQIGGSVTEISSGATRIWVDFGAELPGSREGSDADMIRLLLADPPDAVLFTHIHGDHIGLLHAIPDRVILYLGPVARQMLLNIRSTLLAIPGLPAQERQKLQREYDLLQNCRTYENGLPFGLGDLSVTPIRVDHSVFDSYMLLLRAEGKTILHTGDFRSHGRLGAGLMETLKSFLPEPVDILIMEGTMMSRRAEALLTEPELEEKATALLKRHKYAFLICSSTNLESLASFYRAMVRSGSQEGRKPSFLVNAYVKRQLDLYTHILAEQEGRREFAFYRSYPIREGLQYRLPNGKTQKQHILEEGFLMLVGPGDYDRGLMEQFREQNPLLIYSVWEGYLTPGREWSNPGLISLVEDWKDHCVHLHTSGHAAPQTLRDLILLTAPREAIVPIHTEYAPGFLELDIPRELKERIRL